MTWGAGKPDTIGMAMQKAGMPVCKCGEPGVEIKLRGRSLGFLCRDCCRKKAFSCSMLDSAGIEAFLNMNYPSVETGIR